MQFERSSGILLHPTSLPGEWGIGTFGKEAYGFIDLLAEMKQKLWQVLPLYPTGSSDSPYQALSVFAGNPLLISPEILLNEGWLVKKDIQSCPKYSNKKVDFSLVKQHREKLFRAAFLSFENNASKELRKEVEIFCKKNKSWLADFSLFMALKQEHFYKPWNEWEKGFRLREFDVIEKARTRLKNEIKYHSFLQFIYYKQWLALRKYANNRGIKIIGDNPIYESYDSADVWANPDLFLLDKNHLPKVVAGVPPDCFSKTGQLWENPIYNWKKHRETSYQWWIENLRASLAMTDFVRIDHFIGFIRYWAIPFGEKTAENGSWKKGPGLVFFKLVKNVLGDIPLLAEDLGAMTDEVKEVKQIMGFPGMKIIQEAFDGNPNHHFLPHNYTSEYLVYTGTHDNDTSLGTYRKLSTKNKLFMKKYAGVSFTEKEMIWQFIKLAWSSVAVMAMIPMQDFLGLGSSARMNIPGTLGNNWTWRFEEKMISRDAIKRLREMTEIYGR